MPIKKKNLSEYNLTANPAICKLKIGIVVSEWNNELTKRLLGGAALTLLKCGIRKNNIYVNSVPGSFELPLGAQQLIKSRKLNSVICLGCLIQGKTRHFEFISDAVANGIMAVGLKFNVPVIFGVLTVHNYKQALARSGGTYGNKGVEAAVTAIKMATLNTPGWRNW